jgi:two-component system response regulator FixJ
MTTEPIVHVIDDDEAVRDSLAFLLETADLAVKTYDSAIRFLEQTSPADAGCLITDIRMPEMTGLELVRRLNEQGSSLPVIVITGHGDVPLAVEAMRAGVVDFIEKPFNDEAILAALRRALDLSRDHAEAVAEQNAIAQRLAKLSGRERQVLDGLVAGQANKVIAMNLGISPRTVEVYRANLMTKMLASSLSELVRMTLNAQR